MNLHRKLWAIYALTVFFLLWIIFFPFYYLAFLLFPKKWRKYIFWFSHKIYVPLFFTLTLIRIKTEGKELLDPNQRYILVSNHVSVLDFMINARAYPGIYKFLAKRELVKIPLFGFVVRKQCVLVDRSSAASRTASIRFLEKNLEDGYSIFVYPEGARNRTDDRPLLPFHKGAFKIAIETGCPIAVQTIVEVRKVARKATGLDLWPGTIKVVWSQPIEVKGLSEKDTNALMEQVRQVMMKSLEGGH